MKLSIQSGQFPSVWWINYFKLVFYIFNYFSLPRLQVICVFYNTDVIRSCNVQTPNKYNFHVVLLLDNFAVCAMYNCILYIIN